MVRPKKENIYILSEIDNYVEEIFSANRSQKITSSDDSINWFFDVVNIINWDENFFKDSIYNIDKDTYDWTATLTDSDGIVKQVKGHDKLPEYTDILIEIINSMYEDNGVNPIERLFC